MYACSTATNSSRAEIARSTSTATGPMASDWNFRISRRMRSRATCPPIMLAKSLMISAIVFEKIPTTSRSSVIGPIQPGVPWGTRSFQYPTIPFARIPATLNTTNVTSPRPSVVDRLPVMAPPSQTASPPSFGTRGAKGGIMPRRLP